MPKLRYKEDKKEKKRHGKSSKHKRDKEKPYKPPKLYEEEEGWVPSMSSEKRDDLEWREHLFEAMMDDEGQDPFYSRYEHSQPTPSTMSDEEYRQHIVHGMYQRTHAEEIKAEEKRKLLKEKKKREKEEARARMEKENLERIRVQNVYNQIEELKKMDSTKTEYNKKWNELELLDVVYKKDIPWPVQRGKSFTFENVKIFLMDSRLSAIENKKIIRKEQTRYHPDKFITKYIKNKFNGSDKEKERIYKKINEISSWINELWKEINQ